MPGRRRAPVKRPRAQKTARRAETFPILRIEQPLTDAINFAQALYLMGFTRRAAMRSWRSRTKPESASKL